MQDVNEGRNVGPSYIRRQDTAVYSARAGPLLPLHLLEPGFSRSSESRCLICFAMVVVQV